MTPPGMPRAVVAFGAICWAISLAGAAALGWVMALGQPAPSGQPMVIHIAVPQGSILQEAMGAEPAMNAHPYMAGAPLPHRRPGTSGDPFGGDAPRAQAGALAPLLAALLEAAGSPPLPLEADGRLRPDAVPLREQVRSQRDRASASGQTARPVPIQNLLGALPREDSGLEMETLRDLFEELADPLDLDRIRMRPALLDELGLALGMLQARVGSLSGGVGRSGPGLALAGGQGAGLGPVLGILEAVEPLIDGLPMDGTPGFWQREDRTDWEDLPVERRRAILFLALAVRQWSLPLREETP